MLNKIIKFLKCQILNLANLTPILFTIIDYLFFKLKNKKIKNKKINSNFSKILYEINEKGYYVFENYWDEKKCNNCIQDFEDTIKTKHKSIQVFDSDVRFFGFEHLSKNVLEFHNDLFLELMANYYMNEPIVNAFTLINKLKKDENLDSHFGSGGDWHKDSSFSQFKSFLYLNDVNENNGPLQLIESSHKVKNYLECISFMKLNFRSLRLNNKEISNILNEKKFKLKTFTGKKGTLIIADTACIHRGKPLVNGERYALTNYYVSPNEIHEEYLNSFKPFMREKILNKFNEG